MTRRDFSKQVMREAWERCRGRCDECTAKLFPGKFAYDHRVPDALGGEPTLANCAVLCSACHAAKTFKGDVPQIAKMKRQRDRHIGIRKPSRMPGAKSSPIKIKLDGTCVWRDSGLPVRGER